MQAQILMRGGEEIAILNRLQTSSAVTLALLREAQVDRCYKTVFSTLSVDPLDMGDPACPSTRPSNLDPKRRNVSCIFDRSNESRSACPLL